MSLIFKGISDIKLKWITRNWFFFRSLLKGFLSYNWSGLLNLIFLCCSFWKGFLVWNWSGLNVARYLTVSFRGPVRALRRGRQPEFDGLDGRTGWRVLAHYGEADRPSLRKNGPTVLQKHPLFFFILRYIKHYIDINLF